MRTGSAYIKDSLITKHVPLGYDMSLTGHHVKARNTNKKDKN